MKTTHEEMRAAKLPISFRDYCAHLLIPLNKCRQDTMYMPFKCGHERHEYEKCMYIECVSPAQLDNDAARLWPTVLPQADCNAL